MPYISFVIPFYGVEKFIGQCLESIYSQQVSEEEYEVICVDDCSPDHSKDIVLQYQQNHTNLSLISNTENLRPGGCRNIGVKVAKGQYIWFVDSDDKIEDNILKSFVELCQKHQPDVLAFNFVRIDSNNSIVSTGLTHPNIDKCENGLQYIKQTFGKGYEYYIFGYPWSYIYRKDYLIENDIFFPEKLLWEDTVPPAKALFCANKVFATNTVGYCYRVNPQSITEEYSSKRPAEYIYQFVFNAGKDVLDFAPTIQDDELREVCYSVAKNRYFNSVVLELLRTNRLERRRFFEMFSKKRDKLSFIKPYLKPITKCLLTSCKLWNLFVANIGSLIYKISHRKK